MARPHKTEKNKYTKSLPAVRCNDADYAAIIAKASKVGMSVSEYVRTVALKGKIVVRKSQTSIPISVVTELKKEGLNLNQMTKNMHIFSHVQEDILLKLTGKLDRIYDKILADI